MKKLLRYGGKTLAWVAGIVAVIWIALLVYVHYNEDVIVKAISSKIEERTKGEVRIGGLSVSLFSTFPVLSLQLKDVLLRDSLYKYHKKDLLTARNVYLRLSIPDLIRSRKATLSRITMTDGSITLLADSTKFSNQYIFQQKKGEPSSDTATAAALPDVVLRNVLLTYSSTGKQKFYKARVESLKCRIQQKDQVLYFAAHTGIAIENLAFNTKKGGFLKGAMLEGRWNLHYDKQSRTLMINNQRLDINDHPFFLEGHIRFDSTAGNYDLKISSKKVDAGKTASLLADSIAVRVKKYSCEKPVDMEVRVTAQRMDEVMPLILVTVQTENNNVQSPFGSFEACDFTMRYDNEIKKGKPRFDENSEIVITNFKGKWEGLPTRSKMFRITNLTYPYLECDLQSDVDLQSLNQLTGSNTFHFEKGRANVDVVFRGSLSGRDSAASTIDGEIKIAQAAMKYLPRNFALTNCNGSLNFRDNDLTVPRLTVNSGTTVLEMKGRAENFLSLLDVSPEKLRMFWTVTSPHINLEDFKAFLTAPASEKKSSSSKARFGKTSDRIDKMFADGDVYLTLQTPQMDYKTFEATDVHTSLVLKPSRITLEKGSLKHASGSMELSGTLSNGAKNNPVALHTRMQGISIPVLFASFQNFGQDALTAENIEGRLSATVDFNSAITNDAQLLTKSSSGMVKFMLEDGELINFKPLEEAGQKVFKKQDFSHIRFADLENKLDIKGSAFIINPMTIRSTALNFSVEGVYDVKEGTDISIRFPLRNLTKSQANTDLSDAGKEKKKGLSVRLRAKTGDDGKLKITWDPFKFSLQNKKQVKDSADAKE